MTTKKVINLHNAKAGKSSVTATPAGIVSMMCSCRPEGPHSPTYFGGFFFGQRIKENSPVSRCVIYLDESGDLGFNFSAAYRTGGSSRHLTLAAVICQEQSNKHIKRFIRDFYIARSIPAGSELKWVNLSAAYRTDFAKKAVSLAKQNSQISFATITVFKQRVQSHIQADPNKLYNYMTGLFLLPIMKNYDEVCFVPDARSVKVKSGNSLHDYLQTKLWFDHGAATKLETHATDSEQCRPLHFTDYLCGAFQSHFEDRISEARNELVSHTACSKLFFP